VSVDLISGMILGLILGLMACDILSGRARTQPDEPDTQPPPDDSDHPAAWDMVIADMKARDRLGQERYGKRLRPFNGRDQLRDAYEESLDKVVYLRAAVYEVDDLKAQLASAEEEIRALREGER